MNRRAKVMCPVNLSPTWLLSTAVSILPVSRVGTKLFMHRCSIQSVVWISLKPKTVPSLKMTKSRFLKLDPFVLQLWWINERLIPQHEDESSIVDNHTGLKQSFLEELLGPQNTQTVTMCGLLSRHMSFSLVFCVIHIAGCTINVRVEDNKTQTQNLNVATLFHVVYKYSNLFLCRMHYTEITTLFWRLGTFSPG